MGGCTGIFDSFYDELPDTVPVTKAGQLYIDASEWDKWHFIDLREITEMSSEDSEFQPNSAWKTLSIPLQEIDNPDTRWGIYTYWYDVFGNGISVNEFRSFYPTLPQEEPESWTFAVHRNNARTNNCKAVMTGYTSFDQLPEDRSYLEKLTYTADRWSENEVWCEQSRMLSGLIGNQGIYINPEISSWLEVSIPPIPPSFSINSNVIIIQLPDNTYGALQLENYQSPAGVKCCLTINYRYPI